MRIGGDAVSTAARAIARAQGRDVRGIDLDLATAAVLAMAPVIITAERSRIAGLIDHRKLELLALWLDEVRPGGSSEVQDDLRQWASVLRGGQPAPSSVADVLIEAAIATGELDAP